MCFEIPELPTLGEKRVLLHSENHSHMDTGMSFLY